MKKSLFGILAFLILLHVLLSILIVISPETRRYFSKNTLTRYYADYTALGPFFTANSVRSSHDLAVSFKSCQQWTEWDYPIMQNYSNYLSSGSLSHLKRAEFEKYIAGRFYQSDGAKQSHFQSYLLEYLVKEYATQSELSDSLKLIVLNKYRRGDLTTIDTVGTQKHYIR